MAKIRTIGIVVLFLISTMAVFVPAASAEEAGPAPMDIAPMGTQRVVLAELMTGAWCGPCVNANKGLQMVEDNFERDEVVILAYHSGDQLSNTEGNARLSLYNPSGIPHIKVDGKLAAHGSAGTPVQNYNRVVGLINQRSVITSPLRLTVEWDYDDMTGEGDAWINITAVDTPSLSNLKLHTVVFEMNYGPYNGGNNENWHNWSARDFLESEGASGTTVSLTQGQTKNVEYSFDTSSYAQDREEIGIIAFVQSHGTGLEVLQAAYVGVPVLPNVPPTISDGQASTLEATEDDEVQFKVWYRDTDDRKDKGPSEAKVYLKNGTNDPTSHDLIKISSGDPFTVGKWMQYTNTLTPGTYTYRFSANDGEDDATGDVAWNATQITILPRNKVPQLSTHSYAPQDGDTNTVFRFDILYRDLDNEEPAEAKIYIDNVGHDMDTDSTGPWNSWATFYYETTLSVKDIYRYYFTFSDGEDSVRMPSAGASPNFFIGPEVLAPNNEPYLTEGKFTPAEGTRDTEFTFTVKYTDAENAHPTISYVYIDDVPYIMNPDGSVYDVGVTFRYTTRMTMGGHDIHFGFNDGKTMVRFPATGYITGPVVTNMDPVAKIAAPADGVRFTPDDYIPFSAVGSDDPEGDEMSYKWTSDVDGELSTLEAFDKPLSEGEHTITLEVTDSWGGVHSTSVSLTVKPYEPHTFIVSITPDAAEPVEMDRVKYTVTLNNDGEIQDTGVEIRFLVDGVQISSDTLTVQRNTLTDQVFTWPEAVVGTHTITIEVGKESMDLTEVVAANTLPEVTVTFLEGGGTELEVEPGKDVYFTIEVTDANGDDATYFWDFGDGMTDTRATPTHVYSEAGTYTVKVTVTDERGGVVSKELTVTVTKPQSDDESPGFGALLAASAFLVAMLVVVVRRRR